MGSDATTWRRTMLHMMKSSEWCLPSISKGMAKRGCVFGKASFCCQRLTGAGSLRSKVMPRLFGRIERLQTAEPASGNWDWHRAGICHCAASLHSAFLRQRCPAVDMVRAICDLPSNKTCTRKLSMRAMLAIGPMRGVLCQSHDSRRHEPFEPRYIPGDRRVERYRSS